MHSLFGLISSLMLVFAAMVDPVRPTATGGSFHQPRPKAIRIASLAPLAVTNHNSYGRPVDPALKLRKKKQAELKEKQQAESKKWKKRCGPKKGEEKKKCLKAAKEDRLKKLNEQRRKSQKPNKGKAKKRPKKKKNTPEDSSNYQEF